MGAAYFYHLTQQGLDQALLEILPKCLGQDWRVLIRGSDPARLEWLDEKLWLGPEETFLPHGLAGGEHDGLQPILLADIQTFAEHDCLMAIDGAPVTAPEVTSAQRTCILFEAADAGQMAAARTQWAALTDQGVSAKYWSQETGRWALKAEKN